ncbi:MAG: trimeric intracellular cation channel family protein [Chromatiales bacterium]|nr:trimeric intracellular cation channel family protein [Chromatiales bacterium]
MTTAFVALLELVGTFAFAISGAVVAVRHRLDLFGVLVLSFAAATAGGMMRDLLLGATPPVSLVDWRYLAVSLLAGLLTFFRHSAVERMHNPVQLFDAIGLGLFAVLGAGKALAAGLGPVGAVMLGVVTGVGGGIARDVLVAQIPHVLRRELYAVAALAGAGVVVSGDALGLPAAPVAVAGAVLCFTLRWLAIRRGWRLPVAGDSGAPD